MTETRAGFRSPLQAQVTVAEMADAHQAGYDDGYKEGKTKGYHDGLQAAQDESRKQLAVDLAKVRQLVQAMQHPFQDFKVSLVEELKSLTREICAHFLGHVIQDHQALLIALTDQALNQLLPSDHQIVVHCNQCNSDILQLALQQHLEPEAWRIKINTKLSDGNIFLESGHSKVKIDISAQLDEYLKNLDS